MAAYADMTADELRALLTALREEHASYQAKGLKLNMARGKPSSLQLDLSSAMLDVLNSSSDFRAADGTDVRNYGVLDGLPEAKQLMACFLDDEPDNIVVLGNSSLAAMHDTMARCFYLGTGGSEPWASCDEAKFLCPVPGYDRHFSICELFGIRMIPVSMDVHGPNMDEVERLVAEDAQVKGMWCVPQYSNPSGITYSDETVRRLANMTCAADDFRIFWDNAYAVHHLSDNPAEHDHVLDIGKACAEAGHPDRYFKFASTSKVTLPGAGLAAMAASPGNIAEAKQRIGIQTVGHDKVNQLRHVRFLRDAEGVAAHMKAHAALLQPKFKLVTEKLEQGLAETGVGSWTNPRGGYFVSFDTPAGCAQRTVALAKEAGVTMTDAGATWPYGRDPHNSNIRIAPSLPPLEELDAAMDVFVCCVKLAAVEKLLAE